jgi:hypothetical protein
MADRNSIIEKIRALLSKTTANGCTEPEMLEALAKARAWQDTYEVSDDELQLTREEKVLLHHESKADALDPNRIKWKLSYGVSHYCNVRIYRRAKGNGGNGGLTFLGHRSDTDFATWLLDHLADYVHNALFEHLLDHDCLAPRERNDETRGFVGGCTDRINDTLIAACKQSETARVASGKALVIIKDGAIKDFMKAEGIHLSCSGGSALGSDGARAAGDRAGYGASFGRPVSGAGAVLRIGK